MSNDLGRTLLMADGPIPYRRESDEDVQCPNCRKYNSPDARFCDQCGQKLPDSAFADLANTGGAIEMAQKLAVRTPYDVMVSRGDNGRAVIRHRQGAGKIGEIYRNDAGKWVGVKDDGKETEGRNHQRTVMIDLITAYNTTAGNEHVRPAGTVIAQPPPLQVAPQQTPLMERFGVPAIRLATPSDSASDGPRTVTSSSSSGASADSGDSGTAGLSPKGLAIYKKLKAKGFPAARALMFARRAQSFGGSKS